jgi:hypothetical protein
MSNQPPYGYPQGQGYQGGGYPPPPPMPPQGSSDFQDFLSFRKMITPLIIQIFFWIGVAVCVIVGLLAIVTGASYGNGIYLLAGLLYIVLGPVLVRIYCEVLILFFRMNESLTEIKNILARRP